jgi:hypothetical protein
MYKIMIAALLLAVALTSATAFAGGAQDFLLHNESKLTIDALFISEAHKDSWEEDVLGKDRLADDESTLIKFKHTDECLWDIKIVQEGDGTAWVISDINLCETTEITFLWDEDEEKVIYKQGKVDAD